MITDRRHNVRVKSKKLQSAEFIYVYLEKMAKIKKVKVSVIKEKFYKDM